MTCDLDAIRARLEARRDKSWLVQIPLGHDCDYERLTFRRRVSDSRPVLAQFEDAITSIVDADVAALLEECERLREAAEFAVWSGDLSQLRKALGREDA